MCDSLWPQRNAANLMTNPLPADLRRLLELCEQHLGEVVAVKTYQYAPCYLWHDRPLYDDFGDQIELLKGDTIYLHDQSASVPSDLFHELGHLVGRKFNLVGNRENGYNGRWEQQNTRLIAQVTQRIHWSEYLNLFAINQSDFKMHAASELWAELFMLWHLQPASPEARLIDNTITSLARQPTCEAIAKLASQIRSHA